MKDKPSFSGPFRKFDVDLLVDQEGAKVDFLRVFSSGKRGTVLRFLKAKYLWDTLTKREMKLLIYLLPEKDLLFWTVLTAVAKGIPKKEIRNRVNFIAPFIGEETITRDNWNGLKSVRIEVLEGQRRLPRTKKYTGYVRSIASLGKGGTGIGVNLTPPRDWEYNESEIQKIIEEAITVGTVSLLSQRALLTIPDESLG